MVEVHLYGRLRQFADKPAVNTDSMARVPWRSGDTVETVLARLGIDPAQAVSNIFVNGTYISSALPTPIQDGDRLGVFPKDMGMLYV